MPWTFAHPAAVLPLHRWARGRLSLAALVVGALTPDLGYYIGAFGLASYAHSLMGLLLVCLPLGGGLLWILHVLRRPLCHLLPQPHRSALQALPEIPVRGDTARPWTVALSLLLGALTHLVWDSFTHVTGWAVEALPSLQQAMPLSTGLPWYRLLQHGSTVVGVLVLTIAYARWLKRASVSGAPMHLTPAAERWRHRLLSTLVAASGLIAVPLACTLGPWPLSVLSFQALGVRWILCATSVLAVLLVMTAVVAWRRKPREDT